MTASARLAEIFAHCRGPNGEADFDPLAYYMAAVCEQERQHMPLIGPSVDRRTLALVYRLANSKTLRGLTCFACAQLFTEVESWTRLFRTTCEGNDGTGKQIRWRASGHLSEIRMCRVDKMLFKLEDTDGPRSLPQVLLHI